MTNTGDSPTSKEDPASPTVTCIIGAYNHSRFVEEALDTAFTQTYENLTVVIFDDASTDDTQNVIRTYLSSTGHSDVPFIDHQVNRGVCATLNEVRAQIDTDYVAFIAADDAQVPHRIEAQVSALEALGPEYGLCYADMIRVDQDGHTIPPTYFEHYGIEAPATGDTYLAMLRHMHVSTPSVLVRTSVLRNAGDYDETLRAEDDDMFLRMARLTKFTYLDEPLIRYRVLADSLWHQLAADQSGFLDEQRTILLKHLGSSPEADRIVTERVTELTKRLYLAGETPARSAEVFAMLADTTAHRTAGMYPRLTKLGVPGRLIATPVAMLRKTRGLITRFRVEKSGSAQ